MFLPLTLPCMACSPFQSRFESFCGGGRIRQVPPDVGYLGSPQSGDKVCFVLFVHCWYLLEEEAEKHGTKGRGGGKIAGIVGQ